VPEHAGGPAAREVGQLPEAVVQQLGADQPPIRGRAVEDLAVRERAEVREPVLGEDPQYVLATPQDPALRVTERGGVELGAQDSS
jgi:hypothetical protein